MAAPNPPQTDDRLMRGIIGMANLGNTCYMNSVIQALRHCPEWTVFVKKDGKIEEHLTDHESNEARVLLAYQDLISSMWAGTGPAYIRPLGFYEHLKHVVQGTIYEEFTRRTPQDAHEFLVWLLDQQYMATQKQVSIQVKTPENIPQMTLAAIHGWRACFEKAYSPLTDLIFGMFRIQYTCGGCGAIHMRWECFNSLKVSLRRGNTGAPLPLNECVDAEFEEEQIDDYMCDGCKKKNPTKKKVTIWRLPKVLILTLKRFTPLGQKDMTPLNYDGDALCLGSAFSTESQEETKTKSYNLFATVDHHGSHFGGHYTSQCYNPVAKSWNRYDDEQAYPIHAPSLGLSTYIMMFR
jgi:ubiquitin carboxyl-terminal hydrolase 2/21